MRMVDHTRHCEQTTTAHCGLKKGKIQSFIGCVYKKIESQICISSSSTPFKIIEDSNFQEFQNKLEITKKTFERYLNFFKSGGFNMDSNKITWKKNMTIEETICVYAKIFYQNIVQ